MKCLVCATLLVMLISNGCSSNTASIRNRLDPVTSVTISYSQTPMVFYREVSGRAAYARDYIHLAPLEVNRSGKYRYFLWLGIWSTMADAWMEMPHDGFESIVVFADGEPLPLEITGWTVDTIGASEPVYLKPVASAADAYFEVTIDQLRVIAEAKDIRLQSTGPQRKSFLPWDEQASAKAGLIEFLDASVF